MYNYIDSGLTVGVSGSNAGYARTKIGSMTNDAFGDSVVYQLTDDGADEITLLIGNGSVGADIPSELFLVVNNEDAIPLTRQSNDTWVSNEGTAPFTRVGSGNTCIVKVYAKAIPLILLDLDLTQKGGRVFRYCTTAHNVFYNGYEYEAVGDLLEIEGLDETADLTTIGTTVKLNGIDPAYRAEIDANQFLKAPIDIAIGYLPVGRNEVEGYQYWHRGYCDSPNTVISYNSEVSMMTIEVNTQSVFGNLDKIPDLCRTSQASHSARHNGDRFFEYVASISNEEVWKT